MHHFAPQYGRSALAFFGTTASMIAVINNVVAGVGIALLTRSLSRSAPYWVLLQELPAP